MSKGYPKRGDPGGVHPNFFIIGAPKCGTTSLASWLSEHPDVFMCEPKEPYYFSSDIETFRAAETLDEYLGLYREATEKHRAVGEASTTYLRSKMAVQRILTLDAEAQFIVCLRNPVEMVASVHAQLLSGGRETERDLKRAWELQEQRRRGESVPANVSEPKDLLYGEVCLLGTQVERLLNQVPHDQVHFVFLQDLARSPCSTFSGVLSFLGLQEDGRAFFPVKNSRTLPRFTALNRLLNAAVVFKRGIGLKRSTGIGTVLRGFLDRPARRTERKIDASLREELNDYFKQDIQLLGRLTKRDLTSWV